MKCTKILRFKRNKTIVIEILISIKNIIYNKNSIDPFLRIYIGYMLSSIFLSDCGQSREFQFDSAFTMQVTFFFACFSFKNRNKDLNLKVCMQIIIWLCSTTNKQTKCQKRNKSLKCNEINNVYYDTQKKII